MAKPHSRTNIAWSVADARLAMLCAYGWAESSLRSITLRTALVQLAISRYEPIRHSEIFDSIQSDESLAFSEAFNRLIN